MTQFINYFCTKVFLYKIHIIQQTNLKIVIALYIRVKLIISTTIKYKSISFFVFFTYEKQKLYEIKWSTISFIKDLILYQVNVSLYIVTSI